MTDYDDFITTVAQRAGVGREDAERASQATLQALAERLSQGEARDLAAQLPPRLARWLAVDGGAEPFGLDEFLRRVALRAQVPEDDVQDVAAAVFETLRATLPESDWLDVTAPLPREYAAIGARPQRP